MKCRAVVGVVPHVFVVGVAILCALSLCPMQARAEGLQGAGQVATTEGFDLNGASLLGEQGSVLVSQASQKDGWTNLTGGAKGYVKDGKLVVGWMDLGSFKYYFQPNGAMSTGWTDVEVNGSTMHYYFNPASGNLVRDTWF